jgi:hypothetical protein
VSNERPLDKGRGWQSDRARDGKLSQGSVQITQALRALSRRSGKAGFFLAAEVARSEAMEYRVNNREETSYDYDNGNGESFNRCI